MKLKVCGMKYEENILELAQLQPDYMGFIFYEKSPRFVEEQIPQLNSAIKKTGVFVNAEPSFIQQKVKANNLQAVQLHGNESAEYCQELKKKLEKPFDSAQGDIQDDKIKIIKAFSIKDEFDFQELEKYLPVVDYFLFDTKGKNPGGNGFTFDWRVLKEYPFQKPFFLSGGIGLNEVEKIKEFQQLNLPLHAIDVNSKFETEPGRKNIEEIIFFTKKINS